MDAEVGGGHPVATTAATGSEATADSLARAVDDAIVGDPLDGVPEAQPERRLEHRDFASLFIRHRWALKCHARRYLTDQRDIEDVVQETFLRMFLAIDELETERQALAFERRVLTNLCIDRYRRDKRRPSLLALDSEGLEAVLPAAESADPVVRAEDAAVVREAMAQLSPLHRAVLVKREIEEKPLPVIAAELGVPEQSVKHLLYRARRALHRLLVGTSVEPAAELPPVRESMAVANRRLGRAALNSAHALIVIIAAAVTAGGLWHARHIQTVAEPLGTPSQATVPSVGGPPPVHTTTPARRHHHESSAGNAGTRSGAGALPVTVTPPSPPHQPASHPTSHPTPPPGREPASHAPVVQLTGAVAPAGAAAISNQVVSHGSGTATALSRVSAPLYGGGNFVLDQALLVPADATPTLQLNAQVTDEQGQNVQSSISSMTPSVTSSDNSQVTVAGEGVAPDGLTVNVLIVYSADLAQIENETVSVGALNPPAPSPSVSAPGTAPGPAQPTGSPPASDARQNNLAG